MWNLIARNSKAIGATIGSAIALLLGNLIPDLAGSEELSAFELAFGAIVGAAVATWFAPKNAEKVQ